MKAGCMYSPNRALARKRILENTKSRAATARGLRPSSGTKSGANGTRLISAFYVNPPAAFRLRTRTGQTYDVVSADIPADARYGKGSQLVPAMLGDTVEAVECL